MAPGLLQSWRKPTQSAAFSRPRHPPQALPRAWLRGHLSTDGPALAKDLWEEAHPHQWPRECTVTSWFKKMIIPSAGTHVGKQTFLHIAGGDSNYCRVTLLERNLAASVNIKNTCTFGSQERRLQGQRPTYQDATHALMSD